jgi:eukaryotic-like serine/threonine-protein kinase
VAAAGLQHPNVVGVYDRGTTDGRHWIAMEYVEGASLKDLIARGLTVGEAVEIVRQVLSGTKFAHDRGIIHRDLKPQNVLVDREGRARVVDFGIARAGASEITQTGSVLGTAQYLSPEQAQGLETGATSDLYSIGVLLYECLTGRVPFEADSPVAVALKQISEPPRRPSEVNPQIPPALDAVVLRALAKDPAARFQSADEFIAALDAAEVDPSGGTALAAAVAEAPPLVPEEWEDPWYRRWWVIALAVLALLLAGVAAFALTRPEKANVPAVVDQPLSQAQALLERKGFEVSTIPVENCAQKDTVTEQDPAAGSEADEGSEVALTISLGLSVKVPPVRGLDVKEATKKLEDEDLLVDTRQQSSGDVAAGKVIDTDPAAGEEVDCRSAVTLLVSKGVNLVSVPDVVGQDEAVARSQLEDLHLIVDVDTKDSDEPEGTVIGQSPGPGSQLERDERVTIVVSTGAGSVIVPDVVGQSEEAARARLGGVGLSVDLIEQETEDRGDDGRVLEQAPAPGSRVHSGDQVTIVVGVFTEPEPTTTTSSTTTTTPDTSTTTTTSTTP